MTTTDELFARLVNLENEAVQERQRQSSAEHALAAAQQRIQQLTVQPARQQESSAHALLAWQFTFKAFACAAHPKMKEVFDLATRKGSEAVVNNHRTAELQSLSTQLHYMLVMMLSDQALEIVRISLRRKCCRSVAQVALGMHEPCVGIRYGAMLQSLLKRRFW